MSSEILKRVKYIMYKIQQEGLDVNETKEIQNEDVEIYPYNMDFQEEEVEIKKYYDKFVEPYEPRLELENDHYKFLKAFLIHKIKENQYFFKLDKKDFTSRKNVIWSSDCVSSIQFLHREDRNILTVIIRSSDTVRLLPIDLLYMSALIYEVVNRFGLEKTPLDVVKFLIVSSHYYKRDEDIVKKILE